ncbi:MAG: extensin family protein [Aestuariivirga sp.]
MPPTPHPMPDGTLMGEACYAELQKLGANFERIATPVSAGACSVSDPVKLTAISRDGTVLKFPDEPTFTCGFAVRFVNWVTEQAEPVVQTGLSAKIATMGTGPGFQCRGRNGDSSAKLSEHGFGNAVDIERFKLANGEVVEVSNAIDMSSKYQPVLAGLRSTGCQYFMTVLGPGTNSAHASHFHFDLERRGKKGNNKLCE